MLVAAAGFGTSGRFANASLATEYELLEVNIGAVMALSHLFSRRFVRRGRGGLVLMSSLLGFQGVPLSANYAATKAYVQTLAEALHLELKPFKIDVIACAPGPVRSGFEVRANMRMSIGQSPESVAEATLRAIGRRSTVRPGLLSKALESSLAPLPRRARSRILSQIMAGMTKHQSESS
jgi:short-subunit dehydrogenase